MTALIDAATDDATVNAIMDSVVTASRAFALTTPVERSALLREIGRHVEVAADDLVAIAVAETGLGSARLRGEVARTANQFRLAADVVDDGAWLGVSIDHARPPFDDHRRMNIPLGPVLVFAASNFPFAFGVLGTDTASALAAGCAVIAKGHPGHPRLARRLAEVMRDAVPFTLGELFTLVDGDAAPQLLRDERIEAGAFTGSIRGGVALLSIAQSRPRPIPFFAEMGSVNPVVVTEAAWAARREEILTGYVASMGQSNGQLCTSPGILLVPTTPGLPEKVLPYLADSQAAPLLTDSIAQSFRAGLAELHETAGVTLVAPAEQPPGRAAAPALWTTTTEAVSASPEVLEERFGPTSVLVQYASTAEIVSLIERLGGQLTGSIFSEPGEDVGTLVEALSHRVGRILSNSWPTGVAVSWSMHHGGPWPASSSIFSGSVGADAIKRFVRPIVFQNFAQSELPAPLRNENPWGVPRRVDGQLLLGRPNATTGGAEGML